MTVPALVTDNIGAFAWWRQDGCYSVELSDVLDYVDYYEQQPEYIDTVLFLGVRYGIVNIRIRSDGYILAWYSKEWSTEIHTIDTTGVNLSPVVTPDSLSVEYYYGSNSLEHDNELVGSVIEMLSGTHSGKQYLITSNTSTTITVNTTYGRTNDYDILSNGDTFRIYSTRSTLPYNSAGTSLGHAIKLIWDQLRGNQIGGSGDALSDYTEVNNYDYEYTDATSLHIFGSTTETNNTFYMTQPNGNTIYTMDIYLYNGYDFGYPGVVINGSRVVSNGNEQKYCAKKVNPSIIKPNQVRNKFVYTRSSSSTTNVYVICLTND